MTAPALAVRARSLSLAFFLLVSLGCHRPDAPMESAIEPRTFGPLLPGQTLEPAIATGEVHQFDLDLPANHVLQIEMDSQNADLSAVVTTSDGTVLASLDSPSSRWGGELLLAIPDEGPLDGGRTLHLKVTCATAEPSSGRYTIFFAEPRPANAQDPKRAAAQALHAEGLVLSENNRAETNEQALDRFQHALQLWQQVDDREGEARTRHWIGLVQKDLSRFEEAEASLRAALELWRQLGNDAEEAESLYRLGALERQTGRSEDALVTFDAALDLWRETGLRLREARTLYNQGLVYGQMADWQLALDHYDQATTIYQALGEQPSVAKTLNNVAVVHQMLGQTDRALEGFVEALSIHNAVGDRKAQAETLNNLGWIYHRIRGEPDRATEYYERALALAIELEKPRDQATCLGNLARVRLDLGDPRGALRDAQEALELDRRHQHPVGQASSLLVMGLARMALGETDAAIGRFDEALALNREIGNRASEAEALYRRAQAHRTAGDLERARQDVEQALAILEAVRTDVDSRSLRSTFLGFRRPYYELEIGLLVDLARQQPEAGFEDAALAASERARARALLDTLADMDGDLRTGVDPAILAEEQDLRRRVNALELERWRAAEGEKPAIQRRLRELLDALEAVESRIRAQSPRYASLARPQPLGLAAIRDQVLDPQSLLLEYSLGDERSVLFAVSPQSMTIHELPARERIENAAQTLYELLIDRYGWQGPAFREHQARYRDAASRLSTLLLDPVADQLAGQRLLIAPEGALHLIPFAALPVPGSDIPLVTDHEIVHLPSASAIAVLRQHLDARPAPPSTLAVLADPVFQTADPRLNGQTASALEPTRSGSGQIFTRLRHSRTEAERIAAMAEPSKRRVILDFEASRSLALSPELARYRFLHFATHGVLNNETPELSGLVLSLVDANGASQDGFVPLHEVYTLDLAAELVVLSACQTGLGKTIRGEGLVGLVRGFLHAGSRRVIASLWQIDDEATTALMERVYHGLLVRGLPPTAALRQAQLAMLAGHASPRWRLPYYWAAFVPHGEWRPVAPPGSTHKKFRNP